MTELELRFLGDLEVVRDGEVLPLPPSRKTRALLAYLALNRKTFRREHLCDLLWDVPDDPRGSLRWSLSKLRRLVDGGDCSRIVADRLNVGFDAAGVRIDVDALHALVEAGLDGAPIDVLEAAAARYHGNLLEGLELPNHHDFQAWYIAERERATRAQASTLNALIRRLADAPERALPHARALAGLIPYDETARATLIQLLVASGRTEEAEQQYQLGARLLKEAGADPTGALYRALRGPPGAGVPSRVQPQPRPEPTAPAAEPLVGRDAELAQLAGHFKAVVEQGRGRVVLVRGEPGIGKSRLLRAASEMARAAGAFLLDACAFESETIRPFALWVDALRGAHAQAAASIFGAGDRDHRERLFDGLSELVARESQTRPVVVIFDDLQWADDSSAAALHYVARVNSGRPFLGILAARDTELGDNAAMRRAIRELRHAKLLDDVPLEPLSDAAVRELIETRVPGASSEPLSKVCGGNPLLAVELARAEIAGDSGSSLAELVRERLARLDVHGADVLRWAAVLAPRIEVATLTRVTGLDASCVGIALDAAERLSMLLPTPRGFRFSHDLVVRSVYVEISPSRRRMMHRRVAELLEKDTALDIERAADLAHHASQSGDPALAARAMVSAGRLCLRFYANEEALTLARKGLQWTEQLGEAERVCLVLELREIMLTAAQPEDWEATAAECVALAERALDHGALSHARLGYHMASHLRWMHGHWSGAHEEILQSERVTRGGSEEEHIVGMAEAAKCLAMLERDLNQADAMLMEAQALASRRRMSHHAIPAALGMLRYHENRLDEAVELFKEARMLAKSAGDRISEFQANEYLAMIDFERGRVESAKAYCAVLLEIGGKLREGSEAPFARALDALCTYALDGEDGALDAALEELRVVDAKHRLAYTLTRAALVDLERQRPLDAVARADEALAYAQALDRPTEMMLAHIALAKAHEAANDAAARARHVAALGRFAGAPVARWARDRAEVLAIPGL
jgi:DNA-binding SARP family transcriptional activator